MEVEFKIIKRRDTQHFGIVHKKCPDEQFGLYYSHLFSMRCNFCFTPFPINWILQRKLLNGFD